MAKKTGKTKSTDGDYVAPPGATNTNRVSGKYSDKGMSSKQYFDSLYNQAKHATQIDMANNAINKIKGVPADPAKYASSVLENMKTLMRGGGLRKHGR